jgi:glycosyltransferase involved in cell wall biosynthesis
MKPSGGTELLYNNLIKYVGQDWLKDINLVISSCYSDLISPKKPNILWQHLSYDQWNMRFMNDIKFINMVDHFVYVSNWQLNEYQKRFPISHCNNRVIRNAIIPIEFKEKPKNKIKIIYTSMPNRGLEVLLDAFEIMNRDDVELTVYSSTIIYGKNYRDDSAQVLFNRAKCMKNVNYKGYAMNAGIRKALQEHHILAYPSIFEETSCLSAIEAGAAGCKIVTTNYGALPETCSNWATYVNYTVDRKELAGNYSKILNESIDNYWKECYDYKEQSKWFNNTYSWENRAKEWKQFLGEICVK